MEKQIIEWITVNFPSVIVSLIMVKAYLNLKTWTDKINKLEKENNKLKTKLGLICRLHTEHHPNDALKIWADSENEEKEK